MSDASTPRFVLERQVGAGPDGVSYQGVDTTTQTAVHVRRLFLARQSAARWGTVKPRITLARELERDGGLPALAWYEEGQDPYLVTPHLERSLAVDGSRPPDTARAILLGLARTLSRAHAFGVVHGDLCPSQVGMRDDTTPVLDLFGLRAGRIVPRSDIDEACAPADAHLTPASDVYGLGSIAAFLLTGAPDASEGEMTAMVGTELASLVARMRASSADERPTTHEALAKLAEREEEETTQSLDAAASGARLGRYELLELLGEGGMGSVYRARDAAGGPDVALKVIRDELGADEVALRRFYREARLLAQLDNPCIAGFIDVSQARGHHFLAMELVKGKSLNAIIKERGKLTPDQSFGVLRQIALALADVHDLGIVHRDIKPHNVIIQGDGDAMHAKLCDFGVARTITEQDAQEEASEKLTRAGTAIGTPHYMAPEQAIGAAVQGRADIYALGITLYKMLCGHVPFNDPDPTAILHMQLSAEPPDIREKVPELSSAQARLLDAMLVKDPSKRIQDGRACLAAIEEMQRGHIVDMAQHPRLPDEEALTYDYHWDLDSPPEALWPHVSNTERVNRAIGLGAVEWSRLTQADGAVETRGKVRLSGLMLDWRELPFEWVAPSRLGIMREFKQGPFEWVRSTVHLERRGQGTHLHQQLVARPRGIVGRGAAAVEFGFKMKRAFTRVYKRIDDYCQAASEGATSAHGPLSDRAPKMHDPFEPPPSLSGVQRRRIAAHRENLIAAGVDAGVAGALCEHVENASDQAVGRIRPRAFAAERSLDPDAVLHGCLHGARIGLLSLLWDVICPRCQIPSSVADSLEALRAHSSCDACDFDFSVDFARSVEIIFRVHPAVRASELGVYCIGGPGHTPHVHAQVHLRPGERFEVDLELPLGAYQMVTRQGGRSWPFSVESHSTLEAWEVWMSLPADGSRSVGAGRQRFVAVNDLGEDVVLRIERRAGRDLALTAAEATLSPVFRELFPGELLAPGQLVAVSHVALLFAELDDAWSRGEDEGAVFAELDKLHRTVNASAMREQGAVVKIHGDGVMAALPDPDAAMRAALALREQAPGHVRCVVHAGPAMMTTINDRLDYFGKVVKQASDLLTATSAGGLCVAEPVLTDAGVRERLESYRGRGQVLQHAGQVAWILPAGE